MPIGISKNTLRVVKYDFEAYPVTTIASNKLANIGSFMDSLLDVYLNIPNLTVFFVDVLGSLPSASKKIRENRKINYFDSNLDELFDKLIEVEKNPEYKKYPIMYIFYGLEKLKSKVDVSKIETLFSEIKSSEHSRAIVADSTKSLKNMDLDIWYSKLKNNTDGIWVGK